MDFVSDDEVESFRNSGQFDEQWYVEQYPDVKLVGMDPATHFLWLGAKLGRQPSKDSEFQGIEPQEAAGSDGEIPRVHFVRGAIRRVKNASESRHAAKLLTPELRLKILESGLFDKRFYESKYNRLICDRKDLLADYITAFRYDLDRDPGPLFSTRFYIESYPDIKDLHPFIHYIEYGMNEGRLAFPPEKVNSFLSGTANVELDSVFEILPKDRSINILYWEEGNFFFTDVANFLEQLLEEQGYRVRLLTDLPELGAAGDALNLVVAPHEFCALGPGRDWMPDQYADAVYVNTEQWQTSWFALGLKYLRQTSIGILDLNPSSAKGLARMGFRAAFLPLLPLPKSCFDFSERRALSGHVAQLKSIEPLSYPERLEDRPYDVLCCGVLNDRRSRALAAMAPVLAEYRCFIHTPRFNRPIKPGDPDVLSAGDFAQISRNSKIMLNIHQGESHYVEWQRVFLVGMMQGAIVLSEPCYPNDYVQPDIHYIECPLERMPSVLMDLLTTDSGKKKMAEIHANVMELRDRISNGERLLK